MRSPSRSFSVAKPKTKTGGWPDGQVATEGAGPASGVGSSVVAAVGLRLAAPGAIGALGAEVRVDSSPHPLPSSKPMSAIREQVLFTVVAVLTAEDA